MSSRLTPTGKNRPPHFYVAKNIGLRYTLCANRKEGPQAAKKQGHLNRSEPKHERWQFYLFCSVQYGNTLQPQIRCK